MHQQEWFILRGENKYGPFFYKELAQMLYQKQLFDWDYLWNKNLSSWVKLCELPDFSPDALREFRAVAQIAGEDFFFRRRFVRAPYDSALWVHNNKKVWKAYALEIGAGGAGFLMDNDFAKVGEKLFLHFKPGAEVPPFNAICSVVSFLQQPSHKYRYGVEFTSISKAVASAIKKYAEKKAA